MSMLGNGAPAKPLGPISLSARTRSARLNLLLEQQVNKLASKLEKQQQESDCQTQISDNKLTHILEVMTTLVPGGMATPGEPKSATASCSATPAPPEPKPYLANPMLTPELILLLTKVCGDPRSRSAQKGALLGEAEHTIKEHVRNTFKDMLGIPSLKVVWPYFLNQYSQLDTIPEQFEDPETGYGVPHPNWDVGLSLQPRWIPTYLLCFRGTIPNNTSKKATFLQELTDKQILIMLHDGPFRTEVISWRCKKKSESKLEALRSSARRYQRANRRLCVCGSYLHQIPSLQGPEWEFLTHIGYMSQEESNNEGVLVTKRPSYRAQWVNNPLEAVAVAEQGRPKCYVTPLLIPPIVHCIETVECPIPKLEQGKGASKYSLLVATCLLSKHWREGHPGEVQAYMHLVNLWVVTKPNIGNFLTKYPMPEPSLLGEPGNYDGMTGLDVVGEYDGAFGTHARSDNLEPDAVVDKWQGGDATGETTETKTGAADILINPTLLNADLLPSQNMPAQRSAGDNADNDKVPGPSNLDCEVAPNSTHPGDCDPASAWHNQSTMPAPLPLELQLPVNTQGDGSWDVGPTSAKNKKGALKAANKGTSKPCGQPPGSKNKSKMGKCEPTYAASLLVAFFPNYWVLNWIPAPTQLLQMLRIICPHWHEHRLKHNGRQIIPQINSDQTNEGDPYVCFCRRDAKLVCKTCRSNTGSIDHIQSLQNNIRQLNHIAQLVVRQETMKNTHALEERQVMNTYMQLSKVKCKFATTPFGMRDDEEVLVDKIVKQP